MGNHARTVYVCGSEQAYQAHIRRGEPTDDACKAAHRAKDVRARADGSEYARAAARRRVVQELIRRHEAEYNQLLTAEVRRLRLAELGK